MPSIFDSVDGPQYVDDAANTQPTHSTDTAENSEAPAKPTPLRVNRDEIPDELKAAAQWLLWRYEYRPDQKKPWTKPPYQPNGFKGDSTKPATWNDFDTVIAAYERGGFDGIGFALTDDFGLVGVDIDDAKTESGGWIPEVCAAFESLDSYAEISPSGNGIRFFTRGTLPEKGRKKGRFEIYSNARYLTVTGHRIDECDAGINERTEAIAAFHARHIAAKAAQPKATPRPQNQSGNLSDNDLFERATKARNGAKFSALWSGDNSGGQSEGDLALCCMLAFWTGKDAPRIDAMFRSSSRWREKWDERHSSDGQTYGQMTIEKAVSICSEVFGQSKGPNQNPPMSSDEIRNDFKTKAAAAADTNYSLDDVKAAFKKYLFLRDTSLIEVTLAATVANLMDGDPAWLMIVGGSSSGKTETVQPLAALPFTHLVGTLTEAAFLSGSSKRDTNAESTGGLLREVGDFGILLLKDFTSLLSIHHDKRMAILAALREIYDGSWSKRGGNDGGKNLEWSGKVGVIACCTDALESATSVTNSMGERFMRYRWQHSTDDQKQIARLAMRRGGNDSQMRAEMKAAVCGFFGQIEIPAQPAEIDEATEDKLIALATFTACGRSVVDRDARTRDIELIHDSEVPARFGLMLRRMYSALQVIGVDEIQIWRVLEKIALDSIPKLRGEIIRHFRDESKNGKTDFLSSDVAKAVKSAHTATKRALEELRAHDILTFNERETRYGPTYFWSFSDFGLELLKVGFATLPDKSYTAPPKKESPNKNKNFSNTVPDDLSGRVKTADKIVAGAI